MEIRWIPVEEQIPPYVANLEDKVDVKLKDGTVCEAFLKKVDGKIVWSVEDVTHWKPTGWKVNE